MRKKYLILCVALVAFVMSSVFVSAAAKTKVQVISWWSDEKGGMLGALKDACEKANPNIEIEYIKVPGQEYYTKLLTMIASGNVPDIAMLGNNWLAPYASKNALEPLDRLISSNKFPMKDMYPAVQGCLKYNGKIYALPRDTTGNVLYYNTKMFDQAGVKYPTANWKWSDFLAAAKALTKVENGKTVQWGFYFDTYADGWYHWLLTNGASFVNAKYNKSTIGSPAAVETLKFLSDLMSKYKVAPNTGEAQGLAGEEGVFLSQQTAMYIGGESRATNFYKEPKLRWDIAPIPYNKVKTSRVWTNLWVVPKGNGKRLSTIWKVLSFYGGPEGQKIAAKYNSGVPAFKSIAESPVFMSSVPAHRKYYLDAFENGKPFPSFSEGDEFLTIMIRELQPVWAGERSVEQAVKLIDAQTNKLFKK